MAFLDNSGDIILDAVLTDTGRFRLARGDGSFKITKFALGDDEINYTNYNKNHLSGSAYFDLEILQTPVLEAFTNNTSLMKSRLITISRTNLLYLPILKLNKTSNKRADFGTISDMFLVAVDTTTLVAATATNTGQDLPNGVLNGTADTQTYQGGYIRVDQGLDTPEISPGFQIDQDLYETQYMVEMDDRLGRLCTGGEGENVGNTQTYSFLDDDNVASYYLSDASADFVKNNESIGVVGQRDTSQPGGPDQVIRGPRGSYFQCGVRAKLELQTSTHLFNKFGSVDTADSMGMGTTLQYIDTNLRLTGVTTGYKIDIPIRYIKKPSS